IDKVIWGRDRDLRYTDRLALGYRIEVATESNVWQVVASSVDRRPYVAGQKQPETVDIARLSQTDAEIARRLIGERGKLQSRIAELAKSPMVYGGTFTAQPETTYRLHRGDPMLKRDPVQPDVLTAIPVKFS